MPELPEVETVRSELDPWLTGRTILTARRVDAPPGPKYANLEAADGHRIEAVTRRGKFLLLPLSNGDELVVHLGMTGVMTAEQPATHLRVEVTLTPTGDRDALYFKDVRRFGRFMVALGGEYTGLPSLQQLGPEPLSEDFTTDVFWALLQRSKVAIKQRLMSQRAVAGAGNIYCDEALWMVGLHPLTPSNKVTKQRADALRIAIVKVLSDSIARRGTTLKDYRTVSGGSGGFASHLNAYGRTGQPCNRCEQEGVESPIARIIVAQRSTHFCPRCQRKSR